jgi:hypothetical protein
MSWPTFIEIDGKLYAWRDILAAAENSFAPARQRNSRRSSNSSTILARIGR